MKIISLNLHSLKEDNQEEKLKRVSDFILKEDIDICLFQEVSQPKDAKILFGNIREGSNILYLTKNLPSYHLTSTFKKIGFQVFEEGLAILSKKELVNAGSAYLSKTHSFTNWLTRFTLFGEMDGITFFDIHLGWTIGEETIEYQMDTLSKMALEHTNPVFILGDYNACYKSEKYQYLMDKGFYSVMELLKLDPLKYPTFIYPLDNGEEDNRVIDHILMNQKIHIKDYQVLFNENPVSDHNLIYLEIEQ